LGAEGLVDSNITIHIFSLLSKTRHIQLYLLNLVYSPHLANPLRLVIPLHPNLLQSFNLLIVAKLSVLNVHGHQPEEHHVHLSPSFLYGIFPHTLLLDHKPQTTQTGDRNKFSPLESVYAPYPIPAWSAALQAVDQSPSNLVEATKTMQNYGHYVFPDPGLFTHPATAVKYLESWLRIREAWFMRVAKESSLALSNQSWRTYLSTDNTVPGKGDTKAARRRREVFDVLLPKTDIYPGVEMRSGSTGPIVWQGKEYPSGVLPPENVVREVLWELYEANFIHELQSLDRRACHNVESLSATELFERQIEISQCFPTGSFKHVSIPSGNIGLADDDFDERFGFVTSLVFIMNSWKGDKPAILAGDLLKLELTPDAAVELEKVVAKYYCQQFFNYFGRAAQVPHRLHVSKS
jgi:hypothetical protein